VSLPDHAAIREAAEHASLGAEAALRAYREGRAPQEPSLVQRTLSEIEHQIDGLQIKGTKWESGALASSGRGAAESKVGADFVGVFEVHLPNYSVKKGFLAQAKLLKRDSLEKRERKRLRIQCEKMLSHTPDAFVWLFTANEIRIVPAISVVAGDNQPFDLYYRGIRRFFEEHFACFIGDRAISTSDTRGLDQLRSLVERYGAPRGLYIGASSRGSAIDDRLNEIRATTGEL
jgi:hypothetical protein